MYFIDEDGAEKPTAEALRALGTIVMFRSDAWAMAILDMVSFISSNLSATPLILPRTRFNKLSLLLIHHSARVCSLTLNVAPFCFAHISVLQVRRGFVYWSRVSR